MSTKFTRGGGQSCAVVGCSNNRKKIYDWKRSLCGLHGILCEECACCIPFQLHKLPADENREKWLSTLNRKFLPKEVFVCSTHFLDGKPTQQNPYPTLNLGYPVKPKVGRRILKRKFQTDPVQRNDTRDSDTDSEVPCEKHDDDDNSGILEMESSNMSNDNISVAITEAMTAQAVTSHGPSFRSTGTQWVDPSLGDHNYGDARCQNMQYINHPKEISKTYAEKGVNCRTAQISMSSNNLNCNSISNLNTGLSLTAFKTLVNVFENISIPFKFTMLLSDQMLLTLMKLRLNLLFADLAQRFGISESHASNIFNSWLPFLATVLKDLIIWLPRETIRATIPSAFKEKYPHTTVIIDCAETFLQRPKNLKTRGETYSHYKSHNTVKYLVGIAPHGQIMFISKSFGGRASDKFIVQNSAFLDFLLPGDEVMGDRGFTIENLLFPLRVKLNIPAFTRGKDQISEEDVTETRRIAHVRIHVERVIRRLKVFKILSDIVPVSCAKKVDDILIVCAALVNLGNPIIKESEYC